MNKYKIWIFNCLYYPDTSIILDLKQTFLPPQIIFNLCLFHNMLVKLCSLDCIRVLSQNFAEFYNISFSGAVEAWVQLKVTMTKKIP